MKIHSCPTCGMIDECDVISISNEPTHHNCRSCGTTWRQDGVVMSGGGEPK